MLSRDALRIVHAMYHEYRYPGWVTAFSDQDLHDALEYLEKEGNKKTIPRRELVRKEIKRRTMEKRADTSKITETRLPEAFCREWDQTCAEIRRKLK